jgi:hypothetical protein
MTAATKNKKKDNWPTTFRHVDGGEKTPFPRQQCLPTTLPFGSSTHATQIYPEMK